MKITIMGNKRIPFKEIAEGTVFRDPAAENAYYIKTTSVFDEDTDKEEWNSLRLDNYAFDCFSPKYEVFPIYNAELIIRL